MEKQFTSPYTLLIIYMILTLDYIEKIVLTL